MLGLGSAFYLRTRSSRDNLPVAHQHGAVSNQSNFGKGIAAPRAAAPQGHQLRCACNEKAGVQSVSIMTKLRTDCT
jgi:hypothetical protein